jgi:hypothetical protein
MESSGNQTGNGDEHFIVSSQKQSRMLIIRTGLPCERAITHHAYSFVMKREYTFEACYVPPQVDYQEAR